MQQNSNFSSQNISQLRQIPICQTTSSIIFKFQNPSTQLFENFILKLSFHSNQLSEEKQHREPHCSLLSKESRILSFLNENHLNIISSKEFTPNLSLSDNIRGCGLFLEMAKCDLHTMVCKIYPRQLDISYIRFLFFKLASFCGALCR